MRARCPPDADSEESVVSCCPAISKDNRLHNVRCTRDCGHRGPHHAHDIFKHCLFVWSAEAAK